MDVSQTSSQKGNSVWILTITFGNPDGNPTSIFHTYILAVGRACYDHTPVIDYFLKEIEIVRAGKMRYCAILERPVMTYFDCIVNCADRPQRAADNNARLLGLYGLRSLWAAVLDVENHPYCPTCFIRITTALISGGSVSLPPCNRCCQWDYLSASPALKKVKMPKDYPLTGKIVNVLSSKLVILHLTCLLFPFL